VVGGCGEWVHKETGAVVSLPNAQLVVCVCGRAMAKRRQVSCCLQLAVDYISQGAGRLDGGLYPVKLLRGGSYGLSLLLLVYRNISPE